MLADSQVKNAPEIQRAQDDLDKQIAALEEGFGRLAQRIQSVCEPESASKELSGAIKQRYSSALAQSLEIKSNRLSELHARVIALGDRVQL